MIRSCDKLEIDLREGGIPIHPKEPKVFLFLVSRPAAVPSEV